MTGLGAGAVLLAGLLFRATALLLLVILDAGALLFGIAATAAFFIPEKKFPIEATRELFDPLPELSVEVVAISAATGSLPLSARLS